MIDIAFALQGRTLPTEHRFALAEALARVLPWLDSEPGAGVHRLKLVRDGGGGDALVSPRTRLVLRVPRALAGAACALAGTNLDVAGHALRPLDPHERELLPHGTLYAHLVAAEAEDEAAFLARMREELAAMEVAAQPVCGRWQSAEAGRLVGCSLMLSGLDAAQSLRVLQRGLGRHRHLGCGLFVPHKSAAAVGAPD
jgi:CRISPR-associated protein Cas6